EMPITSEPGLFADVVLDRPLDTAFTYGVGPELQSAIAVGKRVRVPLGRGNKPVIGYCVNVHETTPSYPTKPVLAVLDEESLLTDQLLRLTRWMADYYLCGWGQVLNAVLPAGARQQAGTHKRTFVELVPDEELPDVTPALTPRQSAALARLREAGKPIDVKQLQKLAECGPGPVKALLGHGMIRRVVRRIDKGVSNSDEAAPDENLTLNADQLRAWSQLEPALQSGGFR